VAIQEGQKLGNYRVLRRIGSGGMGEVFLAEHPLIGKRIALKVIHREFGGANAEAVARFANEARAVSQVGGDHVVQIHDFGETPDGDCFFVMDYLDGRTLAHELAGASHLSIARTLYIGAQLAQALAAVHSRNILHRDLKPDNVMLVERGGDPDFAMLLDFGLAKFLGDSAGPQLTAQGVLIGTPQYMSPEACEGKGRLDHRSDQYALGVLLFQMCTGALPFDGSTMGDVLVQQVSRNPPPPRGYNGDVPPSVEQIILRCLAKDPGRRFPNMDAVREALLDPERYLASSPPVLPISQRRPVERGPSGRRSAGPQEPTVLEDPVASGPSAKNAPKGETRIMFAPQRSGEPEGTAPPQRAASQAEPVVPANRTMTIATPPGHYRRPRRRLWPVALLVVVGAGALVLFLSARGSESSEPLAASAPVIDAGVTTVHLRVVSHPSGAKVISEGMFLGVTPLEVDVPRAPEIRSLRLSHPQTLPREKRYDASRDTTMDVDLVPRPDGNARDTKSVDAPMRAREPRPVKEAPAGGASKRTQPPANPKDRVLRPSW